MLKPDYDDAAVEEHWCGEQRLIVANYLHSQKVEHARIGDWPAWHIAPYVSLWAIESVVRPGWIGWWVISGDLPTDYISSADVQSPQHPRKAIRVIAERWLKQVEAWNQGRDYQGIRISGPHSQKELAALLNSRAKLLVEWTLDDSCWEKESPPNPAMHNWGPGRIPASFTLRRSVFRSRRAHAGRGLRFVV